MIFPAFCQLYVLLLHSSTCLSSHVSVRVSVHVRDEVKGHVIIIILNYIAKVITITFSFAYFCFSGPNNNVSSLFTYFFMYLVMHDCILILYLNIISITLECFIYFVRSIILLNVIMIMCKGNHNRLHFVTVIIIIHVNSNSNCKCNHPISATPCVRMSI